MQYNEVLAKNSWAKIAQASQEGVASQIWSVGDEKDIVVEDKTLTVVIMGFDHDDLADGSGKAGITFGLKNLMTNTARAMNSSLTNDGGFVGSEMYSWMQNTLLPTLPSDLQAVLKSVNKKTSTGNKSSVINTNAMKLFLFSEIEIFGVIKYSVSGEGSQYNYFTTSENRIKYCYCYDLGKITIWWERSPWDSSGFCLVGMNGNASNTQSTGKCGICFGFCV